MSVTRPEQAIWGSNGSVHSSDSDHSSSSSDEESFEKSFSTSPTDPRMIPSSASPIGYALVIRGMLVGNAGSHAETEARAISFAISFK
jgi:hypothetical protein